MARHGFPEKMFIELARPDSSERAVIGSDSIYYVPDNRWARWRVIDDIHAKYRSYTDKGWTILGWQPVASSDLPLRKF
jgi:hypothetical protein